MQQLAKGHVVIGRSHDIHSTVELWHLDRHPNYVLLDGGREVPEEWPTSASSGQLAAGVHRGDFMTDNGRGAPAGAAAIVTALADAGTRVVFGLPGGGPNLDVVGAAAAAGLRFVLARTETAAVIMAATYADLTGRPGAAVVTRGPGLASAVNGIAHAALDRLPVVVIADTVRSADAAGSVTSDWIRRPWAAWSPRPSSRSAGTGPARPRPRPSGWPSCRRRPGGCLGG